MQIKNVIFDLGGVLVNIDYHLTIQAFVDIGMSNFQELFTQAQQSELFDKIEVGEISSDEFLAEIKALMPSYVSEVAIRTAWNAMLLDLPSERLDFLLAVKEKYNTALLSNTNSIHLESFYKELKKVHNLKSLDDYFHKVYFSCDLGMRKPNPETFLRVCELEGFNPSETLFIDDTMQHVEGAKQAGLQALHLDVKNTDVINLLSFLLA
ncbi:MAG TPA: HAD family phosphatase [Brumimicrobium sp.]|nr:HAD family phosphatase [Brumimicrobium sp.]